MKDKDKIMNTLEPPYLNAKLETTNNLIKIIKQNVFDFRTFDNFKTRILITLNNKKGENQFGPLQGVTFHQPTTINKEPRNLMILS